MASYSQITNFYELRRGPVPTPPPSIGEFDTPTPMPAKVRFSNKYRMKLGWTPHPQHTKPSPADCWEVFNLLQADLKEREISIDVNDPGTIQGADGALHAATGISVNSIVKTILSQATDNKLALIQEEVLRQKFTYEYKGEKVVGLIPNYHAIRLANVADVSLAISHGGLHGSKARNIQKILNIIYQENLKRAAESETSNLDDPVDVSDFVPGLLSLDFLEGKGPQELLDWLLALPGVGVKTSYCILQFNYGIPAYAVDTHVMNMANILGWLPEWVGTDLNKACTHLDYLVPDELKYGLHQVKWHHRQHCGTCGNSKDDNLCPLLERKLVDLSLKERLVKPSRSTKILEDDDEKTQARKRKFKDQNEETKKRQKLRDSNETRSPPFVPFHKMDDDEATERGYVLRNISISDGFGESRQNYTGVLVGWYLEKNYEAIANTKPVSTKQLMAAEKEIATKLAEVEDVHKLAEDAVANQLAEAEASKSAVQPETPSQVIPSSQNLIAQASQANSDAILVEKDGDTTVVSAKADDTPHIVREFTFKAQPKPAEEVKAEAKEGDEEGDAEVEEEYMEHE